MKEALAVGFLVSRRSLPVTLLAAPPALRLEVILAVETSAGAEEKHMHDP